MKLAFLTYACDGDDGTCGEESPHYPTWPEAKKAARKAGWQIGSRMDRDDPGLDLCPKHANG